MSEDQAAVAHRKRSDPSGWKGRGVKKKKGRTEDTCAFNFQVCKKEENGDMDIFGTSVYMWPVRISPDHCDMVVAR